MSSRWADACHSALYQPLQISIDANYASSSVTVRLLPSCRLRCPAVRIVVVVDTFFLQIAAFCVSALTGGTMFRLWWRMNLEMRRRVWKMYGWFSGLMFFGSCFGALAWAFHMQYDAALLLPHPLFVTLSPGTSY